MPLLLTFLGGLLLLAGTVVLRGFGEGLRIGRLLSGARQVSISDALEMARRAEPAYVRIQGRIDADEPFLDEHGRPLVVRRERVFVQRDGRWQPVAEARHEVPFVLRDRVAEIDVDGGALAEGLVVIPRETEGLAGEIPERFADAVDPALPVRYRVDQVSAVEHAYAVGMPVADAGGAVRLGPGGSRPLILTTLEIEEAMRILARGPGRRVRATTAALLLGLGVASLVLAIVIAIAPMLFPGVASAASPSASPAPIGDTRSSGEGPGLVGQPIVIALGVVALGVAAAGVSVLYARLSGSPRSR